MSLDLLILGAYVYATLILAAGASGFLYLTTWLRDLMQNHFHSLKQTVQDHEHTNRTWFMRLESEVAALRRVTGTLPHQRPP